MPIKIKVKGTYDKTYKYFHTALTITSIQKLKSIAEKALKKLKDATPKNSNLKLLTYNNETHTLMEWSRITGIERRTISQRLKYGWDIEKALTVSPEVYKNRKSKRR